MGPGLVSGNEQGVNFHSGRHRQARAQLVKCFTRLCLPTHKTSTFVSRAYDKPEINNQSSVDPRVLMEPILSLHYVEELPLLLRYTSLKTSFICGMVRAPVKTLVPSHAQNLHFCPARLASSCCLV